MSEFRLSPEAEADLDGIWLYIARESGNLDLATRVVEKITDRFWLLARFPYLGRKRDDLRSGIRSLPADEQEAGRIRHGDAHRLNSHESA